MTSGPIVQDIRRGVAGGLSIAALYCLWVAGIYAVRGAAPFDRQSVTLAGVLVTYLAIGLITGALVGLLWRFTVRKPIAYLVGLAAGVPVAIGIAICVRGFPSAWTTSARVTTYVFAVVAGLFIGSEIWRVRSSETGAAE
jgi:hypothetical protein